MLTERELATLRAALLYWREEMCPHDDEDLLQPYFGSSPVDSLSGEEMDELRSALQPARARYAAYDFTTAGLTSEVLFATPEAALKAQGADLPLAVILLPERP